MSLRIGSLFSGYGGLEIGIGQVVDAVPVFHSEIEAGPSRVLKHRFPGVPNLGDVTAVDWAAAPPVDVLCGGFPCQDVSLAGLRRGLHPDTRSGLWQHFAAAIDGLRPELVVIENVRGLLSAEAHSDLEPDPWDLGAPGGADRPALRALGAVLGDLADLGYDAEWLGLRAADAGAPHGRFRVFVLARPAADAGGEAERFGPGLRPSVEGGLGRRRPHDCDRAAAADASHDGLGGDAPAHDDDGALALRDDAHRRAAADSDRGRSGAGALAVRAGEPDARGRRDRAPAADTLGDDGERRGGPGRLVGPAGVPREPDRPAADPGGDAAGDLSEAARAWGPFAPAVRRWEAVVGRVAPAPTEAAAKGGESLSPAFVEWMMGLDPGHVTDSAIGLTRRQQLKALGNGVVPQQAALAVRTLLG